ncbi:MAG: hypothetical protein QW611_06450 [Ignisphaera sp.]
MSTFVYDKDKQQRSHQKYDVLDYDELDSIKIYMYVCHQIVAGRFENFMHMLYNYIHKLLRDRYGIDIHIHSNYYSLFKDFYLDIYLNDASIRVYYNGSMEYSYGSVDRKMLRNIIRTLGSISYGIALAILETLFNNPRCVGTCRRYVDNLYSYLTSSVISFPIPDLDAYNFVKDFINMGMIPFKSEADIDKDIYRKVKEKMDKLDKMDRSIIEEFSQYEHMIDQDIVSYIDIGRITTSGITVIFKLLPNYDSIRIGFSRDPNRPRLEVRLDVHSKNFFPKSIGESIDTDFERNVVRIGDVIRNWYNYVTKALEKGIEDLEKLRDEKNIDVNKVNVLKDCLRLWLNIINRYRDEIEKNKII